MHWESVARTLEGKPNRTPVTLEMMTLIKRKLYEENWDLEHKLRFWSVATLLFAGSFRVSEVLAKQLNYCKQTTLLEEDVVQLEVRVDGVMRNLLRVKIKSPKEDRIGTGTTVEIFGNGKFLCPVKALAKYKRNRTGVTEIMRSAPVFVLANGRAYTGKDFNADLHCLTKELTNGTGKVVRSHSFRAAVPSEMARRGASEQEIMGIGRWSSQAWKAYCKLGRTHRMNMADELCKGLP